MLTIFSFLLSLIGSINWLMIGFFQYDFIAGLFGFQASIFSRFFYILFGLGSIVLVFKLIKGKGNIAVFSRKNKKDVQNNMHNLQEKITQSSLPNSEAGQDHLNQSSHNNDLQQDNQENFENHYRK